MSFPDGPSSDPGIVQAAGSRTSRPGGIAVRAGHALLLGVFAFLAVLYRGYVFAFGDQNLYLPFVLHWADGSLFPRDYLLQLNYARESVTWIALALLARAVELEVLVLLAYALTSWFVLYAVHDLAMAWWDDARAAWIAVLLWTPVYAVPGNAFNTVDPYFTGRALGYAITFLVLARLLKERYRWATLLLCLGVFVHVITMIPVGLVFLWTLLERRKFKAALALCASVVLCCLALVAPSLGGQGSHDFFARYDPFWENVARQSAGCLFPTLWAASAWFRNLVYLALALVCVAVQRRTKEIPAAASLAQKLVAAAVLLGLVGVAGDAWNLVAVVQLSLMRGVYYVILVLVLALAGWAARRIGGGGLQAAAAGGAVAAWMTDDPYLQVIGFLVLLLPVLLEAPRIGEPGAPAAFRGWRWPPSAWAAILVLTWLLAERIFTRSVESWIWLQVLAVAAILGAAAGLGRKSRAIPALSLLLAFAVFLFVKPADFAVKNLGGVPYLRVAYAFSGRFTVFAQGGLKGAGQFPRIREAVRAHVPLDATVIVPGHWDDFRVIARRSSFVTTRDFIPAEFSRDFALEWSERWRALYGEDGIRRPWYYKRAANLGEEELLALSGRYAPIHLNYAITNRRLAFPLLAEEGPWKLYEIRAEAGAAPEAPGLPPGP